MENIENNKNNQEVENNDNKKHKKLNICLRTLAIVLVIFVVIYGLLN